MTDIVVIDGVEYDDDVTYSLANKMRENAVAASVVDLGGSRYHMTVIENAIVASETVVATRKNTAVITSAAVGADVDTPGPRELDLTSTGTATSTVSASHRQVISISDVANASAALGAPKFTASIQVTGNASATATLSRPMVITSAGNATATVTAVRHSTASVSSTAATSDSEVTPAAAHPTATAAATETIVATNVRAPAVITASAAATETVTAGGAKEAVVTSNANATATLTLHTHATTSIADEANATERVTTSADLFGNLWSGMNGAAATWSGLPFNSMVEADGVVYGAGIYGLYVMGGTKDDGEPIASEVMWDLMDFGIPQKKRWVGLYVLGSTPSPFTMRVVYSKGAYRYKTMKTKDTKLVQHRAEPGRGLEAVEWRVSLEQSKPFSANAVRAEFESVLRRIG